MQHINLPVSTYLSLYNRIRKVKRIKGLTLMKGRLVIKISGMLILFTKKERANCCCNNL